MITADAYHVPGTWLHVLCLVPHLTLTTTLSFSCYCHSFINKENEVQGS